MRAEHLYVHVPFCARRCVYCDFSIAVRSLVPVAEYIDGVEREIEVRHRDSDLELRTLYLGGGTPSKLGGTGVARLVDAVRARARLHADVEITLEANPEDVSPEAVRGWGRAGINRLSLGVQSFDDGALAWMHRTHDSSSARRAIDVARDQGVENISVDLIFARPASVGACWDRDLDTALLLGLPHLSLYGLTVEAHTPLGRWVARREVLEAPEESFEDEFLRAHRQLTSAGFDHYEVSNYGRPGRHSRHNWAYWSRSPYGGIGPSAHEFDGTSRRWNTAPYAAWLSRTRRCEDPIAGREELGKEQSAAEEVYLSLRTAAGLKLSEAERPHVMPWIDAGWAQLDDRWQLRLTGAGWLRLDSLASDLTLFRSRY